MIDLDRTTAICVRNIIDNPKYDDDIYGNPTTTVTFNGDVSALSFRLEPPPPMLMEQPEVQELLTQSITKKLKLAHARKILPQPSVRCPQHAIARSTRTDTEFVPETSNTCSVLKWLSRVFIFENACDGIELKLVSSRHHHRVYYRPRNIGSGEATNWILSMKLTPNDVELIKPRSADNVDLYAIRFDE